jgi:geranylgeranylglycerol-phosphate geranylgeranyltransferase
MGTLDQSDPVISGSGKDAAARAASGIEIWTKAVVTMKRILNKMAGFLSLTRPVNVIIAGLSILLAGYLCGVGRAGGKLAAACAVGALITAAANGINDYFDVEIDRINKPRRPLPAGRIAPGEALFFCGFCFAAAVGIALVINPWAIGVTLFSGFLLYWYSACLKRTVLWGNLTVSLVTGLAFLFGGIAVGRMRLALVPAAFAFFMHFGREIIKDMEDVEGDSALNARTLPVVYGVKPARQLATAVLAFLLALTWMPWHIGLYGPFYLLTVILGVHTILLLVIWSLWRRPARSTYRRMSNLLKADMFVGLIAIYAGRW